MKERSVTESGVGYGVIMMRIESVSVEEAEKAMDVWDRLWTACTRLPIAQSYNIFISCRVTREHWPLTAGTQRRPFDDITGCALRLAAHAQICRCKIHVTSIRK